MSEAGTINNVMRQFYKQRMARLLNVRFRRNINGREVTVGFTTYGNKHLYSDAVSRRSKHIQRGDLLEMDGIFDRSTYEKSSPPYKTRNDGIVNFHYFKTKLHGNTVYLNVGEQDYDEGRQTRKRFIVYSVTDRIRQKRKARR